MAGGVRNLRAMFEQKPSAEAPSPSTSASSRGRSPAAGDLENRAGSRTGSKVRASFFPVDANKPRNQTPDTNTSTPRRRESNPTSAERHAGNYEILDIQEQAKKELEAVRVEQDIETDASTGLARTPTNQTQESESERQSTSSNNATLHGILSEPSAETKAEPVGFKPEIQRELSQKLERKASERKVPASVQNNSDPFTTNPALDTLKPEQDKINGNGNDSVSETATPVPARGEESDDLPKADDAIKPPRTGDPVFLSPPTEQIMQNLTIAVKPEDQTPTRAAKTSAKDVPQMPRTPTQAEAPKTAAPKAAAPKAAAPKAAAPKAAAPRTGSKPAARSTPRTSRPEAPKPSSVRASSMASVPHPSHATNGNNTLASPEANNSTASQKRGTSLEGRSSVAGRHGGTGTVTTGGFVKPRPKSPTRPFNLPAHLVAPTASSAAKHGNTSGQPEKTLTRRSSTINNTSNFARSAQGPARRPSTRQSSTQQNRRSAESHGNTPSVPRVPDDSFLARMMRPTASSTSKVRDGAAAKAKEPVRPKTKTAPRPKTNGTASAAPQKPEVGQDLDGAPAAAPDSAPTQSDFGTAADAMAKAEPEVEPSLEREADPELQEAAADNGANRLPEC
ncbi:hypothetical protein E2P81_ATG11608 [Venturia nashicola]|uniref:Uncharacterized protein n=1 Tax=Venturia nashicola TaxID=86259 RepID=A0A4Z1NHU5_9PEZI|nr:hypothetical protein E6O75_ATG11303 [Venturia nashicola]TLD18698.1 hypothetical protein E2P81_ATG11608 [Venturia nashicola]